MQFQKSEWSTPVAGFSPSHTRDLDLLPDPQFGVAMPQWVIVEREPWGRRRRYDPMTEFPVLYRAFADLPRDDPDAIAQFASRFGSLDYIRPSKAVDGTTHSLEFGNAWASAITDMKLAVTLWDAIAAADVGGVSQFVRRVPVEGEASPRWSVASDQSSSAGKSPVLGHVQGVLPPDPTLTDEFAAASAWIRSRVNRGMNERVRLELAVDHTSGKDVVRTMPSSLHGALWLQFAQVIVGQGEPRTCRGCGEWFFVDAKGRGRTSRALFCSKSCKSRDFVKRRDLAAKLFESGLSVKMVAEQLKKEGHETDMDTVRKWQGRR